MHRAKGQWGLVTKGIRAITRGPANDNISLLGMECMFSFKGHIVAMKRALAQMERDGLGILG